MSCTCSTAEDFAAELCLGPFVTGDEWPARSFTVWVANPSYDSDLDRTDTDKEPGTGTNAKWAAASTVFADLERVVLQIHTSADNLDSLATRDSNTAGQITIDDANDWEFTVEPYTCTLDAGTYFAAIACKQTSAGWQTFFKGTLTLTGKGVIPP